MFYKFLLFVAAIFCMHTGNAQNENSFKLVKQYINYNEQRKQLSIEYLKERHNIIQDHVLIQPKMIVIHFTGGGTLKSNFNYFNNIELENARKLNKNQSKLNVSAQFLVDRDGTVYQLMNANQFARHTIGLNYCAIGVENVGSDKEPLTAAQLEANIALVKDLCSKFCIEYLIGHHEYSAFRNTSMWKETNSKYFTHKIDPGATFMSNMRVSLGSLQLKSKP